jgi:hypothetical protein
MLSGVAVMMLSGTIVGWAGQSLHAAEPCCCINLLGLVRVVSLLFLVSLLHSGVQINLQA